MGPARGAGPTGRPQRSGSRTRVIPTVRLLADRDGLEAVPVRVDEQGVDVATLAATGVTSVVITPAHQTPTGVVLAPERRYALVPGPGSGTG